MPQATWTGFLSFGLVSVPVALYGATEDRSIHFNQLHRGTSHRVRYRKVDEVTGEELQGDDIVRAFAVSRDSYVVIEDEELRQVAPGKSQQIEVSDFVDLEEIDPVFFQKTYYLAPRTKDAEKAYDLLREAMRRKGKVGIATLVMRDKEYLVAVRPNERVLALETLYFADEIRDATSVLPDRAEQAGFNDRELDMAEQLVASLTAKWEPGRYKDTYRERVQALIEAKREGVEYVVEDEQPRANVVDLVSALQASISKARSSRAASPTSAPAQPAAKAEQQSFEGMSKAELLEIAAQRDVQGRAKMTKLQLVEALTESETEAPKGRRRSAS